MTCQKLETIWELAGIPWYEDFVKALVECHDGNEHLANVHWVTHLHGNHIVAKQDYESARRLTAGGLIVWFAGIGCSPELPSGQP